GLLAETEGESLVDTMSTANSVSSGLDCASPESIMDPTNLTTIGDQYSLGCILYFCLTGRYPFPDGTAVEKMMAHQTKEPTPLRQLNPDVPEELAAVVDRLMQKAPESRFGSVSDLIEALRRWSAPMPQASRQVPRLSAAAIPRPPRPAASVSEDTPRPNVKGVNGPLARPHSPTSPLPGRGSPQHPAPAPAAPAPPVKPPAATRTTPQPPVPLERDPDERFGSAAKIGLALILCITAYLVMRWFM